MEKETDSIIRHAEVAEMSLIIVTFATEQHDKSTNFSLKTEKEIIPVSHVEWSSSSVAHIYLTTIYEFGVEHVLFYKNDHYCPVTIGKVVRTSDFDEYYYYDGEDLGANYQKEATTFRLWAPTACSVRLVLYEDWHDVNGQEISMYRKSKGIWALTINKNIDGFYYTYKVLVNGNFNEVVDPYVKTVSINGEKGMIINLQSTEPEKWYPRPQLSHFADAIIYEAHVRDFSIYPKSGITNKGKYLGISEANTIGPKGTKTGLDYLVDLGITHLELLPLNDFGSVDESKVDVEYNWGYDPIHYFAPEGSYATDPYEGKNRVKELKTMISCLHQRGIRIIIDVVFNHVFIIEESQFEKIVPGYYFRFYKDGTLANGTGVGNDIASERRMVRKFIVDCVTYWAKEYQVDGFRFDLMGILDIETMNTIRNELNKIDQTILMLGEGWNMNTPLPHQQKAMLENTMKMPGICHFNDQFRDNTKGSTFDVRERGFINGDETKISNMMKCLCTGVSLDSDDAIFNEPYQSINYVEVHDNHTLWDKLSITNPNESEDIRKRMHQLGTAMVLTAQGIPFIHAGQEFIRTKYGVENSYQSPDYINQIDWQRKEVQSEYVEYVKNLITIRKSHPAFRLKTNKEIRKHVRFIETPPHVIGYLLDNLKGIDEWERILVIFNGSWSHVTVNLPYFGNWNIVVDEKTASLIPLTKIDKQIIVSPINTVMLYQ